MEKWKSLFDYCGVPAFFMMIAVPYLFLLVFLTPPFQVPDEFEHYFYARAITMGDILPRDLGPSGVGGSVSKADIEFAAAFSGIAFHPEVKATRAMFRAAREVGEGDTPVIQNYWGAALYPPTAYAMPAVGMLIADAIGFDRLDAFYAGRAANALFFAVASAVAIWITPTAKLIIAFILLLPMSLFEAASFSADAPTYALTALACAMTARSATVPVPSKASLWAITALVAILSTIKLPLIALVLPLVILGGRHSRKTALLLTLSVVGVWLAWTLNCVSTEGFYARQASLQGVSSDDQLDYLMHNPSAITRIASDTLRYYGWFYAASAIGVLGWLDTWLSKWFYILAIVIGVIVFVCSAVLDETRMRIGFRLSLFASSLLAAALVFGALYLTWTPVGAARVEGVQGRYFIPVLLMAGLSISGLRELRLVRLPNTLLYSILLAFVSTSLAHVCSVLIDRYYLG